ncbi:MAG: TonB-dependent receptor plug domain-containing protein [Pseudomonadota bacterium]
MYSQQPILEKTCRLAGILLLSACSAAGAAETNQTEAIPQQLQPIVVEGKIDTERADLKPDSTTNLYRVEASARSGTETFTEEEIKALKPENVFDLLSKAAGINLIYQGRRSPYFIEGRGGGTFTYIIDGAVLPSSANRILYKFPIAAIEEMQIVRGATSLTLGPSIPIGASGSGSGLNTGFIIIRTKQPKKTEATLTASAEKAKGGHPVETSESLWAGTRFEGDQPVTGYLAALVAKMDRPSQDSWFDGRSSQGGMGSTGFTLGKLDVSMMAYKDKGTQEMQRGISTRGALMSDKWYYDPLETTLYTGNATMQWSPNQTTLLNAFKTLYDQEEHNESFESKVSSVREFEEESSGIGLRHNARFGATLVQLGGQIANATGSGPNLSTAYNRYDTTITGWSASVEQKLFGDKLLFDGGYRQDQKHLDNSSTQAKNDTANNDVDMDPAQIFAFGSRWRISDIFAVSGRYYHGDQGTSGDFDMQPLPKTGPLHAEKQERIEFGIEATPAQWFQPAINWFSIDTKNGKTATSTTYVANGATYYYYTESDELRSGLELLASGTIIKDFTYKLSWTHMLEGESTQSGVTTDALGVTTPENLFGLNLGYRWHAWRTNLSAKQVDKWTSTNSPMGLSSVDGIGDYTRIDANIQYDMQLSQTLVTATLFGRNLGDENYSTRYVTGYYPDRGRTIGLELSWAF